MSIAPQPLELFFLTTTPEMSGSGSTSTDYTDQSNTASEEYEAKSHNFFYWFSIVLTDIGAFIEVIIVFFLFCEFKKRSSNVKSAYFFILSLGFIVDILMAIVSTIGDLIDWNIEYWIMNIILLVQWYAQFFVGFWNAILAFNRCTALAFPISHQRVRKITI